MIWGSCFGTGWTIAPSNTSSEYPRGGNTKEYQKDQKTYPFCRLFIWKVPQDSMEDQRKILRRFNQETLVDHTRRHDLNWPYGIFPTRARPSSYRVSNPQKMMERHHICGSLIWLLIRPPHEVNLIWVNPLVQRGLWALSSHPQGQGLHLKGG